jgi:hypothetical protein
MRGTVVSGVSIKSLSFPAFGASLTRNAPMCGISAFPDVQVSHSFYGRARIWVHFPLHSFEEMPHLRLTKYQPTFRKLLGIECG